MEKGRSVFIIIEKILTIIPENYIELINELKKYKNSLFNKAPELLIGQDCWIPFINILNYFVPVIEEDWQIEIKNILQPC